MISADKKSERRPPDLPRRFTLQGKKVVLDSDLAKLYGGPTFRFYEAVSRNRRLIEHDSVPCEVVERLQWLLDAPRVAEAAKPKIGFHRGNR